MARDMVWFDTRMGNDGVEIQDAPIGAGGLMAKFARSSRTIVHIPHPFLSGQDREMPFRRLFITLAKGKHAMAELLTLVNDDAAGDERRSIFASISFRTYPWTSSSGRSSQLFRKITPRRCVGKIALDSVTFAYPSRPSTTVLSDASIFLPTKETTFISGDGALHNSVKDLPDGYETRLGVEVLGLSGGQKQRLALARARWYNPTLLSLHTSYTRREVTLSRLFGVLENRTSEEPWQENEIKEALADVLTFMSRKGDMKRAHSVTELGEPFPRRPTPSRWKHR
ncbi:hypothetical protein JOM56_015266 [Amanita muscaria]